MTRHEYIHEGTFEFEAGGSIEGLRVVYHCSDRAGSYQRYQGKKLSDRFDAYSYYYLSDSVNSNNVGRGRGGVAAALAGIKAECTVIGIDSDRLFPIQEQKLIAQAVPGAVYHEITSKFGHDGFLLENDQLTAIIAPLL